MTPLLLAALLLGPAAEEPPKRPTFDAELATAIHMLKANFTRKETVAALVKGGAPEDEAKAIADLGIAQCKCVVRQDGPEVSAMAGGWVVLGSGDTPTEITPLLDLDVDWTLAGREKPLVAHVDARFTGLPDAEVPLIRSVENLRDFNALEMSVWISWRPTTLLAASAFAEGGFASRFSNEVADPKTDAPLWSSFGVAFWSREPRMSLRVGVGAEERLGYGWTMALHVTGDIEHSFGSSDRYRLGLLVRAVLGLETPAAAGQRINQINVGIGAGLGN